MATKYGEGSARTSVARDASPGEDVGMVERVSDIPLGTRIVVVEHADEALRNRTCEVDEVDGAGRDAWLHVSAVDGEHARGWVQRFQVARDSPVDRLGDLYYL